MKNNINVNFEVHYYIQELIKNSNYTNSPELMNLAKYRDYQILSSILHGINNSNQVNFDEQIFKKMDIAKEIHKLISIEKQSPGMILDFGTPHYRNLYISGNSSEFSLIDGIKKEDEVQMTQDTIFDLSGVSIIFTIILLYHLSDNKRLDLDKPITTYCSQYKNLKGVTTRQLMKYQIHLSSNDKLDGVINMNLVQDLLKNLVGTNNHKIVNSYNEFAAMVLKDVIESSSLTKFDDLVRSVILKPCLMKNTYLDLPSELNDKVASNNFSNIVSSSGAVFENKSNVPGTSYNNVANVYKRKIINATGHDGYFSTADDMRLLGNALLSNKIIKPASLLDISDTKTNGHVLDLNDRVIQKKLLGTLCNIKQPQESCISNLSSGKTFKLVGKTGTEFVIDPLNKCMLFIGSNRLHNRIDYVNPECITLSGNVPMYDDMIVSTHFNEEKDNLSKMAMEEALLYGFLENINEPNKEIIRSRKA